MNRIKELLKKTITTVKGYLSSQEEALQPLLIVVILILLNVAMHVSSIRLDLTSAGSYSLSEKSRQVVSELREPLTIKVFFSEKLPAEHLMVRRYVMDILDEYDFHGNRNFRVERVSQKDLEKFAADYGIQPVTSQVLESDEVNIRQGYMGLALQQADIIETISPLVNTTGLEYRITTTIDQMSARAEGLRHLENPVVCTLYLDERLKTLPIQGIRETETIFQDAVREASKKNNGKVTFRKINPADNAMADEAATRYGLSRIRWKPRPGEGGDSGEGVLGAVLTLGEKVRVLPLEVVPGMLGGYQVAGLQNLDLVLHDSVNRLVLQNEKVGYLTGHGEPSIMDNRSPDGAGLFREVLSDMYEVEEMSLADGIPDDIGTLIINAPVQPFSEEELYALDQFLMKGNSLILFVKKFQELQMQQQNPFMQQQAQVVPVSTGLEDMLAHYGITINSDIVLDKEAARANAGQQIIDYPVVPVIRDKNLSDKSEITRHLTGLAMVRASSIEVDESLKERKDLSVTELVRSSEKSWLMTGRINFNPLFIAPAPEENMKSYLLAAKIEGTLKSYFAERPKPSGENKKGTLEVAETVQQTIGARKSGLVVVASGDMTGSQFILDSRKILSSQQNGGQQNFANEMFLHSITDVEMGNAYVPAMMSKGLGYNPINPTDARVRGIIKWMNIAGIPVFVVVLGLLVWRRRNVRVAAIKNYYMGESDE